VCLNQCFSFVCCGFFFLPEEDAEEFFGILIFGYWTYPYISSPGPEGELTMLGSPAGPGGPTQRGLWPLAPAPAPSATSFTADGFNKCGVYSLFPGGPTFGSALYSHARTIGQFTSGHIQQSSGSPFYHKDSLFSPTGYTFGAPTPPPGSPYSPVPVTQLELLAKGFNSNIIIQQPDYPLSPKRLQVQEKRCDEKCCSLKPQKTCNCQIGSPVKKFPENATGCSRTNPIEWCGVNVKKEPGATPCQVAEITTSVSPVVKLEVTSPRNDGHHQNVVSNSNINGNIGNIPVGIAVARQRFHQQEVVGSPSLPPAGLLTTVNAAAQIKEVARISEIGKSLLRDPGSDQLFTRHPVFRLPKRKTISELLRFTI
jgi:hypothetical protein